MLRAGALIYTLVISLVIYIICGAFILVFRLNISRVNKEIITSQLNANCTSAIQIFLNDPGIMGNADFAVLNLFDDGKSEVRLDRQTWGVYEVIRATSSFKELEAIKSMLTGTSPENLPALYIANHNEFIRLSGNTMITGSCVVPGGSFRKAGLTSGKSLKQMAGNTISKSEEKMPLTVYSNYTSLKDFITRTAGINDSLIINQAFASSSEIKNEFENRALHYTFFTPFSIDNLSLNGKIIIESNSLIEVLPNARLNNVILYAPQIIFREGFRGSVQAFADSSVVVEKNCTLEYPSSVCIYSENASEIRIHENATVAGGVIMLSTGEFKNLSQIDISVVAECYGLVYSNAYVYPGGEITGSLYANKVYSRYSSGRHENSLVNAVIDQPALSQYFALPVLFNDQHKRKMIEWLE